MPAFRKPGDIAVAVVGYGAAFNMGPYHLNEMKQAGMRPCAVVDTDPSRLEVAQQDFAGIETYRSVADMLKRSEANLVTLITPHNTHAKLAVQCLRAGRHVVCEKPFAITTAECDRMIGEASRRKRLVSTYHNRHWDGCILEAVRQIRKGVVGDIVRIDAHWTGYGKPGDWWRSSKSISGGVGYDWGAHVLEYSLQLLDAPMAEVTGHVKTGVWAPHTKWKNDTNEDELFATVRFGTGQWLTLLVSTIDAAPKRSMLQITGTRGTYMMDHGSWELIQPRGKRTVVTKGPNPSSQSRRFYQNIADHLTGKAPLVITGQWARRPIHILDLATRSAHLGRALKVKYE